MAAEFKKNSESAATVPQGGVAPATAVRAKPSAHAKGEAAMRRAAVRRARGRGPFKIADTYLFSQLVASTLRSLLAFAGLLIIAGALTAVRRFANGELSMAGVAQVLIYQLPRVFVFTLPMSVLFGTVSTFSDLSNRGEIVALTAGGWNLPRLLRAPLVLGALLAISAFFLQELFVPGAETRKAEIMKQQGIDMIAKAGAIKLIDPPRGPLKSIVQAERFDPESNLLINPSIQFYKGLKPSLNIQAKKGFWDQKSNRWKFIDGKIIQYSDERERGVPTDDAEFSGLEFSEIWNSDVPAPERFSKAGKSLTEHLENGDFEMVSILDLREWRDDLISRRSNGTEVESVAHEELISGATFGIHDKIATPLICIALILVGAPLGIRPQRSSGGFAMGISLIVVMAYYVTWTWASQLGKAGKVPPIPAAYFAVLLTLIVGCILVAKKNR